MPERAAARVVLIGLRGSGKSTVGRLLADRLGSPFVDLDDRTAAELGVPSPAAGISKFGLDAFRAAESRALRTALTEHAVLALGGGTPTAPGAEEQLRDAGAPIVYLHAAPDTLRERLGSTDLATRPSLTGQSVLAEIDTVYLQRDTRYRGLAESLGCVIESGGTTPEALAEQIAGWMEAHIEDRDV